MRVCRRCLSLSLGRRGCEFDGLIGLRLGVVIADLPFWELPLRTFIIRGGAAVPLSATAASIQTRTGGCLCQSVRCRLRGGPYKYGICHCADYRKESGSVFVVYAHWLAEDAEVTGWVTTFKGRSFLRNCGSRLFDLPALRRESNGKSPDGN